MSPARHGFHKRLLAVQVWHGLVGFLMFLLGIFTDSFLASKYSFFIHVPGNFLTASTHAQ